MLEVHVYRYLGVHGVGSIPPRLPTGGGRDLYCINNARPNQVSNTVGSITKGYFPSEAFIPFSSRSHPHHSIV